MSIRVNTTCKMSSVKACNMKLEDYDISPKVGFLLEDPLVKLPEYFDQWNVLARKMLELVKEGTFREHVEKMTELDDNQLLTYKELRLAHTELSVIGSGYIWQNGPTGAPDMIPRCLAVPWYNISKKVGLNPILHYPPLVLNNYTLIDPDRPLSLDNMKTIYQLPGGVSFDWFCIVTCSIELKFSKALEPIISILKGVEEDDTERVITNLQTVTECLKDLKSEIAKLHEKLTGYDFFQVISPFLSGWDGNIGTPPGLIYEGVENNQPIKLPTGNAGQSAIIQVVDALLGIEHSEEKKNYLKFIRSLIVPKHCQFIEDIRNIGKPLKTMVANSTDEELKKAYKNCVDALTTFRSYHIQVVTKYMVIPDRKMKKEAGKIDTNDRGLSGVINFLKELRQDTKITTSNT